MLHHKFIYFLILLFFFSTSDSSLAYSGESNLKHQERLVKINEYLSIAYKKLRTDSQEAMNLAQEAKKLSQGFSLDRLVASNIIIAQFYQQTGNLDTALLILNEAKVQTKTIENDTLLAELYHSFGLNHQYSGSSEFAIENYHKALSINESLGRIEKSIFQLNNIGLLYREAEEFDLALEYLERGLRLAKENRLKKAEIFSHANIGYVFMKQEKWKEAMIKFDKILELDTQVIDTLALCTMNYLISDVKLNLKDYPAAKAFAQEALEIANFMNYVVGIVYSKRVLSEAYLQEKKYARARAVINETSDFMKGNSVNLYLEDVLKVSYQIEYETGNFKKALNIQNQLSARRDSLNQIETKEKISNSEYKYQLLQNEQENQLLKIKNESSEKASMLAITVAVLLLLVLFLFLLAFRNSKNHNKTLEQAIKERTQELENSNIELAKSNKELATSNEELERFAFIASHDLKTPLRDIVSFTGLLERQLKSEKNEKIHEYLSFIKKGGMRLNNLISDTLEFSRLSHQAHTDRTELINLNILLDELERSLAYSIKEKNAKILKLSNLPTIRANQSSIILLFQNLIENSIKYNESEQPTIKISISTNQDYLSVFIEDNGIGIPVEYKENVFVMFSRLHNKDEYEGSGLGLAICKKIINQLNGEIQIQSVMDQGSIFEIKFPLDIVFIEDFRLNLAEAN